MWQYILTFAGTLCMALAALLGLPKSGAGIRLTLVVVGILLAITGQVVAYRNSSMLKERIKSLQPRSLSSVQRKFLSTALAHRKGSVCLICRMLDGESKDYAMQIESVFSDAGWDILQMNSTSLNDLPGYLTLAVPEGKDNALADFVQEAFSSADVDCRPEQLPKGSVSVSASPDVFVIVGRK